MYLEMNLFSEELGRETQVNVIIPDASLTAQGTCKVLYLLHGLSDNHTIWMRRTSIERYAEEYNIAVVMPNVDRSWYTDTAYGANYFSFVAKELPRMCYGTFRQLSSKREDTIAAGLSMGGYGALKLALTYPEQYGTCISLSGALDITRKGRFCDMDEWRSIFGFDLKDPLALMQSEHDVFALAQRNKERGLSFPRLFLWCGVDDSFLSVIRWFDQHLSSLGVAHEFRQSEGEHCWKWWDLHIQTALQWAFDH